MPSCGRCWTQSTPEKTAVCILADKEEIGSDGVTGMQSEAFDTFMEELCDAQGATCGPALKTPSASAPT
jgi:aspartyl aminopeptidase